MANLSEDTWFLNGKKVMKKQMLSKTSQQIVTGISMTLENTFGCLQTPIRRNAYFISDDLMMYISGKHIVLYDVIRKHQSFIMKEPQDEQIQAFNYTHSKSGQILVAMAFKSTSKILPSVKVYHMKKQKFYQLVHSHLLPQSKIIEVTFLTQGKNVVTLSKQDDICWLSVFEVRKESAVKIINSKLDLRLLQPINVSEFLICGPKDLLLYCYSKDADTFQEEINLIQMMIKSKQQFLEKEIILDVAVVQETYIVAITSSNRFIIFKDSKFHLIQPCGIIDPQQLQPLIVKGKKAQLQQTSTQLVDIQVSVIKATSKGVIVGTIGQPIIQVYELDQQGRLISRGSQNIKDADIYGINSIDLAKDEMYVALSVIHYNKQIFALAYDQNSNENVEFQNYSAQKLIRQKSIHDTTSRIPPSLEVIMDYYSGKVELFTFNLAIVEALKTVQKDPFEPLFEKGVHKGVITGIATTPMRSILASVCEDKSFKLWDYSSDYKELFCHYFHEQPNCVALHPYSFLCAVGFKEGMRIYFVLDDDIKLIFTENMKTCTALQFSDGGNYLASSNASTVCIYNPFKFKLLYSFSNHQANIKDLQFSDQDSRLTSVCQLGVLYVWKLSNGERVVDHALKANKYNTIVYDSYYDLIIGAGIDGKFRVYAEKGTTLVLEQDTSPTIFTYLCVSVKQSALFCGTQQGTIRIYSYPFYHFNPKLMEFIEIPIHQGYITSIKTTPDLQFLITTDSHGSIFFSRIKQFFDGKELTTLDLLTSGGEMGILASKITNAFPINQLCLTSHLSQESRKDRIKELDFRLQNFRTDIEDEKQRAIANYNDQIKNLESKNSLDIGKIRDTLSGSIQKSDNAASILKGQVAEFRKKEKDSLVQIEEDHAQVLIKLYETRDKLENQLKQINHKQNEQKQQALKEYQTSLQQVDDEFIRKYQELYQRFSNAMNEMKSDQRKFKEVLQQGEREYETFYKQSQQQLQEELSAETKKTEDLRSQISKFTKETERLSHRKDFLEGLVKDTTNQVNNLQNELITYSEKHKSLIMQLSEKEDLINQREQQIKDFRMKNVHLQNFQKVYDYRVSTLKDERDPLQEHLKNMDQHVKNLYNELIEEAGLKQTYEQERIEAENKIKQLKSKLRRTVDNSSNTKRKIDLLEHQIFSLLKENTNVWSEKLIDIQVQLAKQNKSSKILKGSIFSETIKDMVKDPIQEVIDTNNNENIQKELSSQKTFLEKKLVYEQNSTKNSLEDREQTYYAIQSSNTQLIHECNRLRDTKIRLKEHIDKQTKALRELRRDLLPLGIFVPEDPDAVPPATHQETDEDIDQTDEEQNQWGQWNMPDRQELVVNIEKPVGRYFSEKALPKKTPFAQYEDQKRKQVLNFKVKHFRHNFNESRTVHTKLEGKKLLNELYEEVRNTQGNEQYLRERLKQKANAFIRPSDTQVILPSVLSQSVGKQAKSKPRSQQQQITSWDARQQLISAGQTLLSRNTKNSTNSNFFLQTHTSVFTQKTKTPNTAAQVTRNRSKKQKN